MDFPRLTGVAAGSKSGGWLGGVRGVNPFAGAGGVLALSSLPAARSERCRVLMRVQRAKPFAGARGVLASSFPPPQAAQETLQQPCLIYLHCSRFLKGIVSCNNQ